MNIVRLFSVAAWFFFVWPVFACAATVEVLSYEKMMAEADVVVIASAKGPTILAASEAELTVREDYANVVRIALTQFTIDGIIKGDLSDKQILLEHYQVYSGGVKKLTARPRVPEFRFKTESFGGAGWGASLQFQYLMFLKKMPNQRYRLLGDIEQTFQAARVVVPTL